MLLGCRLGRSTDDRLLQLQLQGKLGVDVSPDEHLAGVAAQAAEVDALREGAGSGALDFTFELMLSRNRMLIDRLIS